MKKQEIVKRRDSFLSQPREIWAGHVAGLLLDGKVSREEADDELKQLGYEFCAGCYSHQGVRTHDYDACVRSAAHVEAILMDANLGRSMNAFARAVHLADPVATAEPTSPEPAEPARF